MANAHHTFGQIDVEGVEAKRLTDPQASHCDQAEQRRAGKTSHPIDRWQLGRGINDGDDLRLTIDVGSHAPVAARDASAWRHLVGRIKPVQPLREQPHDTQASGRCDVCFGRPSPPPPGLFGHLVSGRFPRERWMVDKSTNGEAQPSETERP
jgi:hypothetical protein